MTGTEQRDEIYRAKVNLETSQMEWKELERFFASGAMISVEPELDLVEVAFQISQDNKKQVENWLAERKIGKVSDEQARRWSEANAALWAVVVKPWVLVQPV
ncbi:MAG: DUF2288 domain-containing protein [Pseudomonadota bacterium]|jgi:hypothetical protein